MQTVRRAAQPLRGVVGLLLTGLVTSCSEPSESQPETILAGSGGQSSGETCFATGGCTADQIGTGGEAALSNSGGTGGAGTGGGVAQVPTGGMTATGGTTGQAPTPTGGTSATVETHTGGRSSTGGRSGVGNTGGTGNSGGEDDSGGTTTTGGRSSTGGRFGWNPGRTGGTGGTEDEPVGSDDTGGTSGDGNVDEPNTAGTSSGGPDTALPKFVGNITTMDSVDTDGKKFATYWDQITPENAGKWGSVQRSAGSFNWNTLDAIYQYTEDNDIIFKQHTFIWGAQQPGFNIGEADVKSWMTEFCTRYPNTKVIDVVNEPPPHTTPSYANSIGGGTNGNWQWITNAFKWADEACPNAILVLNDYNNTEWSNDASHFIDIVKTIMDNGAPIDAVGAQAHDYDKAGWSTIKPLIERLHSETGLPIYITEYDPSTSNDDQQLNWYKEQVSFFLETEYIHGVTIWGWIYGKTWNLAPESGLIRNGSPRPAMTWLMETLGRPVP